MRLQVLAAASLLTLAPAAPASAQIFGGARQDRQIEALQRDVTAIQQQLNGANGQPGLAGARDEITRVNSRVEDLEQSLRSLNGTVESLTTDLATTRRANEAADERNRDLSERVTRLETTVATLRERLAQAEAQAAPAAPAEEQPAAEGAAEPAGAAATPASPDEQFAAARAAANDPAVAEARWAAFIAANPRDPRVGQANHFLGEVRYARQDWRGAAAAYAQSLRGWPTTPWAAESTLKLADTLGRINQTEQACAALGEFDTRYAAGASARGRQRAAQTRTRLACS